MIRIQHDIKVKAVNLYYLNGIRVWFGQMNDDVHVGDNTDCSRFMSVENSASLVAFAKSLMSKTGKLKIDLTYPFVKKFLEVTKCI